MNTVSKSFIFSAVVAVTILTACSGGGGSGGGAAGATSPVLKSSKMSCSGVSCIGNTAVSLMSNADVHPLAVSSAVAMYDSFNTQLIPALNNVISVIEQGVANAGAQSCDAINLGFVGTTTANSVLYNVKTQTSSAVAPTGFTTSNMTKKLQAQVNSNSFNAIEADVVCGAGTNGSPLVARVIADNGTDKMNAWFEKGATNHIRILMVAKSGGVVYTAWFKTDDGDAFEVILAAGGNYYKAIGSKTVGSVNYSENGGADSCVNATTGAGAANCGTLPATSTIAVTGVPATLGSARNWSAVDNTLVLVSPAF